MEKRAQIGERGKEESWTNMLRVPYYMCSGRLRVGTTVEMPWSVSFERRKGKRLSRRGGRKGANHLFRTKMHQTTATMGLGGCAQARRR